MNNPKCADAVVGSDDEIVADYGSTEGARSASVTRFGRHEDGRSTSPRSDENVVVITSTALGYYPRCAPDKDNFCKPFNKRA